MTARSNLGQRDRAGVLLEEYRCLYGLVQFRMAALDRRVPLAGSTLALSLGGAFIAPLPVQVVVLVVLPFAVLWLVRTTINHARSFEDALRRIEQIEAHVNEIASEELLAFQSSHPSRQQTVGGRTGRESVFAACLVAATTLVACLGLVAFQLDHDPLVRLIYLVLPVGVAGAIAHSLAGWTRYKY